MSRSYPIRARHTRRGHRPRLSPRFELLEPRALLATIAVTGTGDTVAADGVVTLREAITSVDNGAAVNADVVPVGAFGTNDEIDFNIPGAGVHTITPQSALPTITVPVKIDGYTQPGASANTLAVGDNAVLLIELVGTNVIHSGLVLAGGGSTIRGLVINRFGGSGEFSEAGIFVQSSNNVIEGNFIGVDPTGTARSANLRGVRVVTGMNNLIGGTTPAARNVISGNGAGATFGNVTVDTLLNSADPAPSGTIIRGNYIGTNAAGTAPIVPLLDVVSPGVLVLDSTGTVIGGSDADDGALDGVVGARNVISGNHDGVLTAGTGTSFAGDLTVQGNFIGVDATGAVALGNLIGINFAPTTGRADNTITIGGTAAGAGNVISGNDGDGASITNSNVLMQGNRFGTDLNGTLNLGNAGNGATVTIGGSPPFPAYQVTIGGTTAEARNIFSGNGISGLRVFNPNGATTVQGNDIGVKGDGVSPLGNVTDGILAQAPATIGGTAAGAGNVIAFNGRSGVGVINQAIDVSILGNSIFSNTGLGIDLGNDGVTPNDPSNTQTGAPGDTDTGPNNLQNFPTITQVARSAGSTDIQGLLDTQPGTYHVEIFASDAADPSGHGEGRTFLGSTSVDVPLTGVAFFELPNAPPVGPGQFISGTATDASGNTSEFGPNFAVPAAGADLSVVSVAGQGQTSPLTEIITVNNAGPDPAAGVTLSIHMTPGTTFASFSAPAGFTVTTPPVGGNGNITATSTASLAEFESLQFTLVVQAAAGQLVDTSATVSSPTSDPDMTNNMGMDQTFIQGNPTDADLGFTIDAPASAPAGGTIAYTIMVDNSGPGAATNAMLSIPIPASTTFVSFTAPGGWTPATPAVGGTGTVTATNASFASGGSPAAFTLVVRVNPGTAGGTTITAAPTVHSDLIDRDPDNEESTATTTVIAAGASADVGVAIAGMAQANNQFVYTVTVTDHGPDPATGTELTVTLPVGFDFVSASGGVTPQNQTLTFPIGTLTGSTTRQVILRNAAGQTVNAAVFANESDPVPLNNETSFQTPSGTPSSADLAVAVSGPASPVSAGGDITYRITLTNHGPDAAQGANVSTSVPAGTTFVSLTVPDGWTSMAPVVGGTGAVSASESSMAAGQAVFTLVVHVNPTTPGGTNITLNVQTGTTTSDPATGNNTATATVQVAQQQPPPVSGNGPTVANVQRFGFHAQPTHLVLTFSGPMALAPAQDRNNFLLLAPGADGKFGTRDDRFIKLNSAQLDSTGTVLTLVPSRRLPLRHRFLLAVNGNSPGGLTDTHGRLLDGDNNGSPGGTFVATITRDLLAGPIALTTKSSRRLPKGPNGHFQAKKSGHPGH